MGPRPQYSRRAVLARLKEIVRLEEQLPADEPLSDELVAEFGFLKGALATHPAVVVVYG